jgi:regulator of cell morphogenesis and NO signaling
MSSNPDSITIRSRVGTIAADHPIATRSLHRHRIDFCCGGGLPLEEACRRKNVDPQDVLSDIRRDIAGQENSDSDADGWTNRPLPELVDHIVNAYHEPLREELPRLEAMLRKVIRVHGHVDPERLNALLETFLTLKTDLDAHMRAEEEDLFPRAANIPDAGTPISTDRLVHDHDDAGRALRTIRELTDDFVPPAYACNTWKGVWAGLETLERELHDHIHLENNILFPRMQPA